MDVAISCTTIGGKRKTTNYPLISSACTLFDLCSFSLYTFLCKRLFHLSVVWYYDYDGVSLSVRVYYSLLHFVLVVL